MEKIEALNRNGTTWPSRRPVRKNRRRNEPDHAGPIQPWPGHNAGLRLGDFSTMLGPFLGTRGKNRRAQSGPPRGCKKKESGKNTQSVFEPMGAEYKLSLGLWIR